MVATTTSTNAYNAQDGLAAEPEDALRHFRLREDAASSIGDQWTDAYRAGYYPIRAVQPSSAFEPPLRFEATLHFINEAMDHMAGQDWTEDGYRTAPAWVEVRAAARGILTDLGQRWDDATLRQQVMGPKNAG